MDKGLRSPGTKHAIPIYVNPEVDITYRGRDTCLSGDTFKIRRGDWLHDKKPIAATKTLAVDWEKTTDGSLSGVPQPCLSIGTVKRFPLHSFPLFQKLPVELQDMVWQFALNFPRVITLAASDDSDPYLVTKRQPALASVCRASRRIVTNHIYHQLPGKHSITYYDRMLDTVRIEIQWPRKYRDFSKYEIRSLGIPFESVSDFSGEDAKLFRGLREIVILIGHRVAEYEMEMIEVPEMGHMKKVPDMDVETGQKAGFLCCHLKDKIERVSKNWKAYQRRRVK